MDQQWPMALSLPDHDEFWYFVTIPRTNRDTAAVLLGVHLSNRRVLPAPLGTLTLKIFHPIVSSCSRDLEDMGPWPIIKAPVVNWHHATGPIGHRYLCSWLFLSHP